MTKTVKSSGYKVNSSCREDFVAITAESDCSRLQEESFSDRLLGISFPLHPGGRSQGRPPTFSAAADICITTRPPLVVPCVLEFQILIAFFLDLLLTGDPRWLPHPGRLMGGFATALEMLCRRFSVIGTGRPAHMLAVLTPIFFFA